MRRPCSLCLIGYLLVYVALNTADLLLTLWGLRSGSTEGNPIPIAWKAGSLLTVTLGLLVVGRTYPRIATGVVASLCLFYAGIIGWNLAHLLGL